MTHHHHHHMIKGSTRLTVIVSLIVLAVKLVSWKISSSLSLKATFLESCADVMISVVNFLSARYAMKPADFEHRFGHGKAEAIASLSQVPLFCLIGSWIMYEGIQRIVNPIHLHHHHETIGMMVLSICLNIILLIYQKKTLSQTRSLIILCDYTHYKMDLLMHLGIVISLVISLFYNIVLLDVAIAMAIGAYIFYSSFHIAKESLGMLMDTELPIDTKKKIIHEITSHTHVRGFHNLRTYQAGSIPIIQFHLELDDHLPLVDAHKISDDVEEGILKMLPLSDITIHLDPFSGEFKRSQTFHDHFTKS